MDNNTPGARMLHNLINQSEHWLLINLFIHGLYTNKDSSRIEGLFGLFKTNYGHERGFSIIDSKLLIKIINR